MVIVAFDFLPRRGANRWIDPGSAMGLVGGVSSQTMLPSLYSSMLANRPFPRDHGVRPVSLSTVDGANGAATGKETKMPRISAVSPRGALCTSGARERNHQGGIDLNAGR